LIAGTGLANAPLFQVSAITGDGIDALREHLVTCSETLPQRPVQHNFRLAVDRRFDISGAGLVVTGTVFSGSLNVGESISILGADMRLRVRAIHAQNAEADVAVAGQRCALNLAGPELRKDRIGRGDWVVAGAVPAPVRKLDANFRLLASEQRPAANWTPVHVHIAAAETTGRLVTLEGRSIAPDTHGLVQLVMDRPLGAVHGDHFILRDQSAKRTIGGGVVIDVYPPARGRSRPERLAWLRGSITDDSAAALSDLLRTSEQGVDLVQFAANRNLTEAESTSIESQVEARIIAIDDGRLAFAPSRWGQLKQAAVDRLKSWHKSEPGTIGLSESRVLEGAPIRVSNEIAAAVASELVSEGAAVRQEFGIRLPTHAARLQGADAKLWQMVEKAFEDSGFRPLTAREIASSANSQLKIIESLLLRAGRLGLVARISKTRFVTPSTIEALQQIANRLAAQSDDGLLMVTEFRDASGIGRNMSIEVLEYFDKQKFTQRQGDGRILLHRVDADAATD
ncbi:MAG: SelB C-terminal domain-containing protein, partial [Hyphomicrobiaceae bacterium]